MSRDETVHMIIELLVKRELSGKLSSLSYVLIRMNWHNSVRLGSSLKNKNHVRKDNIPWWLWFIYLPFYDSVQHRIFEVSLVHKGLITVARSVLWMSFTRVEHHCISTSSIHVLKLVRRDKTWDKQTNKQTNNRLYASAEFGQLWRTRGSIPWDRARMCTGMS